MAAKKKTKHLNAHRGCAGGANCRHCIWDNLCLNIRGPHAKYLQGYRGRYRGDIDGALDDFAAMLKREARRLLRECAKETPVLRQFHLDFE
jgi:hypothetical protein